MPLWVILFLGAAITLCTVLLIEAFAGFWRVSHGEDNDPVGRRLTQIGGSGGDETLVADERRDEGADNPLTALIGGFQRLVEQSGTPLTVPKLLILALALTGLTGLVLFLLLKLALLAVALGVVTGFGFVLLMLLGQRKARIARFEEQLPDAIDLMVRSMRVGHPVSTCISIVATEMAAPIGAEFQLAHYKISYGYTVSQAFREMAERVPLHDLRFLVAVMQLQEETGGNPTESLGKLANMIRERFRMFQKINAITAEGRVSAWLLSVIPFVAGFGAVLVKPDYYDKVMQFESFPWWAAGIGVLLVLNIIVMKAITNIKV